MLFDLVFENKMWDLGWVLIGSLAAAVDGAVYEVLDALFDGLVYQSDSLASFVVVSGIGGLFLLVNRGSIFRILCSFFEDLLGR